MAKVLVVAQVKDLVKWEENFRTHRDLFKSYTVTKPVSFGTNDSNHVAVCFEPEDLAVCMGILNSAATGQAMELDGVMRETVKIFVLDKEAQV